MRVGIVGCGSIAHVHVNCILHDGNNELIAVADTDIEKVQQFADNYHATAYASLEQMLIKEKLEVIHICTPHYLHIPMAITIMQHGIHVFMEKPPLTSYEQWNQIEAFIKSNTHHSKLGFCFQNRYNESVQYVKALLNRKEYGNILGARAFVTWSRNEDYYRESNWRGS